MEYHELLNVIPKDEVQRVMNYEYCEIDYEFMGFTEVYKQLALIIPKHFIIIDMGCYCAAQSYYFTEHKQYIGVDVFNGDRFKTSNTVHYVKSIQDFISENIKSMDLNETFAICSYVPDENAKEVVRQVFKNLFVYYPAGVFKALKNMICIEEAFCIKI